MSWPLLILTTFYGRVLWVGCTELVSTNFDYVLWKRPLGRMHWAGLDYFDRFTGESLNGRVLWLERIHTVSTNFDYVLWESPLARMHFTGLYLFWLLFMRRFALIWVWLEWVPLTLLQGFRGVWWELGSASPSYCNPLKQMNNRDQQTAFIRSSQKTSL